MNTAELLRSVRDFARQSYAWPGGYPMILWMDDGGALCSKCARSEYRRISESTRGKLRDGWGAAKVAIHYEGPSESCSHCGTDIESAYGDPDAD